MLAEREDGAIDDQRVIVIETNYERSEYVVGVDFCVGDLIQRLSPNVNVRVAQGTSPIVRGDETLADHASKREDAVARYRALQIGAQDFDVVVAQREAGAQ
jgi:hypothetical protein